MTTNLECNDGELHDWQFAGRGQRRCDLCQCFGFIPKIRTNSMVDREDGKDKTRSGRDSQGVAFHLCQAKDCHRRAVGRDIVTLHSNRKQWRCTQHRGEYT